MVGGEVFAHRRVEFRRTAKPDLFVMQPLRIVGRAKPEIEKRLRAGGQGSGTGSEGHGCIVMRAVGIAKISGAKGFLLEFREFWRFIK
jgi:hypothetical protein